ncbi:glycosyltransferase family 2 protein [Aliiglaciecola sp. 2_MG-2023]|uniref:glycosyltransferase family 2 protein n=1 Tax=unclassified Aliiglaciecola TaxID=2593648 RepID=UPI0026E40C0C|nr:MULTISPECIES: glycosyltransferase family 2 protein [unclassified Aliiglaciecola]MDO6712877.1 glycosyltransferase family 2 protein [Aliiglaciecola sp. 2_MG-2023]MDO6752887.1 glycosyltransferase family 2 protein [Aliiglaciecola sp. 1_MG-2023]
MSNNLTVIILTFNEKIHIKRCIESVSKLSNDILVIDSYSTDETCDLATSCGAKVFQNPFVNQAQQFQWAMDNCGIDSTWVLRLDADETLDDEMIQNIREFIANDGYGHNAGILNRKHIFLGKWVKHGGRYPLPMLRLFKRGTAHVEQRWMDEHIVLDKGTAKVIEGGFEDNNINSVSWFIDKHNKYATREMVDIMLKRLQPESATEITENTGLAIRFKRFLKESVYMKLPYFVRPFLYFNFRYFIQLGFLDGARGFAYHFMQAFWYRALVDLKCIEVERLWSDCTDDTSKIAILEQYSGYQLS